MFSLLKKKAEQKRLEEQKRKQEEELRIQEAKRKEEMARWKMEEEQRRAAEEAKVRFCYVVLKCLLSVLKWYFLKMCLISALKKDLGG